MRASLLGPSLTIPFVRKTLTLGTWQQVVYLDFDIRPRQQGIGGADGGRMTAGRSFTQRVVVTRAIRTDQSPPPANPVYITGRTITGIIKRLFAIRLFDPHGLCHHLPA